MAMLEEQDPRPPRRFLGSLVAALYLASLAAAVAVIARRAGDHRTMEKGLLSLKKKEDKVAWIPIHGVISASEDGSPWKTGAEYWTRKIKDLGEREDVKALVLEINSPGGSVGAVQEIYAEIERIRKEKKKPVVALMGDVAASGGYYLAAGCDKIVAHPGTLTGSIGVIFEVGNIEGLLTKLGVKMSPIKSGKHKDIGSMTRAMTPEEREILQAVIDDAYGQFLGAVQQGRGLGLDKLKPLADGRIFTGRQARDLGLVDMLGSSEDALHEAARLGGIKGTPKVLRVTDPFDEFFSMFQSRLGLALGASLPSFSPGFDRLEYLWKLP